MSNRPSERKNTDYKQVLFVTTHNPWGTGGGCTATRIYLSAIREIYPKAKIDICLYDRFKPFIPKEWLENPLNTFHFSSQRPLSQRIMSMLNGQLHRHQLLVKSLAATTCYDLCVFDKSQTGATLFKYFNHLTGTTTVTIHHNFEPDYFKHEQLGLLFRIVFYPHVKRLERISYKRSDINLYLTAEDLKQSQKAYGQTCGKCIVSGMFEEKAAAKNATVYQPAPAKPLSIVIAGSLNNIQNTDGINYFFSELYPLLPTDCRIIVTGQKPTGRIVELCTGKANVTLIPNPADISAVISSASIFLCPTRLGSGMKIRILDGLRAGLPVIAHNVSARGYNNIIESGIMRPFSTPDEFINAVRHYRQLTGNGTITSENIKKTYVDIFSHESGINRLRNALNND